MKFHIEVDPAFEETEVVVRCARVDDTVQALQQAALQSAASQKLVFYKAGQEFYFPPDAVLFFETGGTGGEAV
ncbi:MAG: LytTR family transcriptional regulator, partial [Oscillospiraceae bacterium]